MSRHVSVVMPDDLFAKMESERGRESKSSFVNHVLALYFAGLSKIETETE